MTEDISFRFTPSFDSPGESLSLLISLARELSTIENYEIGSDDHHNVIQESEENFLSLDRTLLSQMDSLKLDSAGSIMLDLTRQGWGIKVANKDIRISAPSASDDIASERQRIQAQERLRSSEVLDKKSTRSFITGMESPKLYKDEFVSIFSLMRDGRDLSEKIIQFNCKDPLGQKSKDIIRPYLQVISGSEDRCQLTGFALNDIWRYFRYTWTNPPTSVPGRTIKFLVRDRAASYHPVIGLGALSSPIVQLTPRDKFLGWTAEEFLAEIHKGPDEKYWLWANNTLNSRLNEIHIEDLLREEVVSLDQFEHPDKEVTLTLTKASDENRIKHGNHPAGYLRRPITDNDGVEDWQARAESPLYRSKRYRELAKLLKIKIVLKKYTMDDDINSLKALLSAAEGRTALAQILRIEKSRKVGVAMADLTVCGAIAPYNLLLGGKLISAFGISPEMVNAYQEKYANYKSEIASGMAGRPINRQSDLVFIGTTSLYGVSSSQYNRIKIPIDVEGENSLIYKRLGKTVSYGTSHFSNNTLEKLVDLTRTENNGPRVNSIFGEGVSPKLRKIKAGFDILGLENSVSDKLLRHGRQRLIYGISLVTNLRDYLIGLDEQPKYKWTPESGINSADFISNWWFERWGSKRLARPDIINEMRTHNHTYPIKHGSRPLTPNQGEYQTSLWSS
jgi:hypothetical protein